MTTVTLIRHAESAPDHALPEADWPLSAAGFAQAEALADQLDVEHIYSSPYVRAVATVAPLANRLGLEISTVPGLRERKLAEGRLEDWRDQLARTWHDFDYRLPGGESSRACQLRVSESLTQLAEQHTGARIAAASHGNAIALFLHTIDPTFGFEAWSQMRNPDLFEVTWSGSRWAWRR